MEHSDKITTLAPALVKAQADIKAAIKDSTNPHFKSKYADLAAVIEAVKAPLLAQGITFLQGVSDAPDGVAVETMLLHQSGEWMSSTCRIPASKQDAQGYGSAITYGRRYGLQALTGLPAEDDDGNAATAAAPAKSAITPNSGAGDALTAKQKKVVLDVAACVKEFLKDGNTWNAYAHIEEQGLDNDEKLYLWAQLDSRERADIKAASKADRSMKEPTNG